MDSRRNIAIAAGTPPGEPARPLWQRWGLRCVALLLVTLLQGPATFVQELAWAGMLVNYTRAGGVVAGVKETFDGEHPCSLCKKAAEIRRGETEPGKDEKSPAQDLRLRHVWTEMMSSHGVALATPKCRILPDVPAGIREWKSDGRGADAPPSPPPEWIG